MLSVLLVDDEFYVREMMKKCVDWEELGFQICAEAASCASAIKAATEVRPDLIMLDINLPDATGFHVVEALRQADIQSKIVIVTGYDEFEFAKKAIQYHVHDYLLKPVMPAEITGILKSIRAVIEDEQQQSMRLQALTANVEELLKQVDHSRQPASAPSEEALQESSSKLAEQARDYVEANLSDPDLNVSKVSEALFVNMSYLSSLFKKIYGRGLHEYIVTRRMERAYDLIIKTSLSAAEIAQSLGFRDPIAFSRHVKKHFGNSFQELRRIRKKYIG